MHAERNKEGSAVAKKKAAEAVEQENKKTKTPSASSKKKSVAKKALPAKNKAKGEAAPVKKAKKSKKPEWEKIKTEYILGNISYQKLAAKHKVSINTLKGRAKREKWGDERKASRENVQKKKRKKLEDKLADEAAQSELDVLSVANDLLERISNVVSGAYIEPKEFKSISGALKDIQEMQSLKDNDGKREIVLTITKTIGEEEDYAG